MEESKLPNYIKILKTSLVLCQISCICLMHILQALSIFINMREVIFHLLISLLSSSMLADKLNMTPEEAERWIVNLIRNARLDAKLDSKLVRLHV